MKLENSWEVWVVGWAAGGKGVQIKLKKIKDNLKDLWNNVKHNNIHIIGESQKEKRENMF